MITPTGIDPRHAGIAKRIGGVGRVLVFASGKGGVGKSSCATVAGLILARQGHRVGLLDLDFQGATDHIFLGTELGFPEEERGILPVETAYGLRFMSIALFSGEHGIPMRGADLSNALIEIMTVTVWDELDYLVLDMPPGIGDEVLDVLQLIKKAEVILVTSASVVSGRVVGRFVEFCSRHGKPIRGIVENLRPPGSASSLPTAGQALAAETGIELLCSIPRTDELEAAIGSPAALLSGTFARELARGLARIA